MLMVVEGRRINLRKTARWQPGKWFLLNLEGSEYCATKHCWQYHDESGLGSGNAGPPAQHMAHLTNLNLYICMQAPKERDRELTNDTDPLVPVPLKVLAWVRTGHRTGPYYKPWAVAYAVFNEKPALEV